MAVCIRDSDAVGCIGQNGFVAMLLNVEKEEDSAAVTQTRNFTI